MGTLKPTHLLQSSEALSFNEMFILAAIPKILVKYKQVPPSLLTAVNLFFIVYLEHINKCLL